MSLEAARKRHHEIRELEEAYGREFLKRSLSEAGMRWRELTAPNAAEWFDGPETSKSRTSSDE